MIAGKAKRFIIRNTSDSEASAHGLSSLSQNVYAVCLKSGTAVGFAGITYGENNVKGLHEGEAEIIYLSEVEKEARESTVEAVNELQSVIFNEMKASRIFCSVNKNERFCITRAEWLEALPSVRMFRKEDIKRINTLRRKFYKELRIYDKKGIKDLTVSEIRNDTYAKAEKDGVLIFVAVRNKVLIGYALAQAYRLEGSFPAENHIRAFYEISEIYTEKSERRKGIGNMLIEAIRADAKIHGYINLTVSYRAENEQAECFLRSNGFCVITKQAEADI